MQLFCGAIKLTQIAPFYLLVLLYDFRIDHIDDFTLIQSKIIIVKGAASFMKKRANGDYRSCPIQIVKAADV